MSLKSGFDFRSRKRYLIVKLELSYLTSILWSSFDLDLFLWDIVYHSNIIGRILGIWCLFSIIFDLFIFATFLISFEGHLMRYRLFEAYLRFLRPIYHSWGKLFWAYCFLACQTFAIHRELQPHSELHLFHCHLLVGNFIVFIFRRSIFLPCSSLCSMISIGLPLLS